MHQCNRTSIVLKHAIQSVRETMTVSQCSDCKSETDHFNILHQTEDLQFFPEETESPERSRSKKIIKRATFCESVEDCGGFGLLHKDRQHGRKEETLELRNSLSAAGNTMSDYFFFQIDRRLCFCHKSDARVDRPPTRSPSQHLHGDADETLMSAAAVTVQIKLESIKPLQAEEHTTRIPHRTQRTRMQHVIKYSTAAGETKVRRERP
ncbi:hypothetical protein F2P81_004079 [Scophthalmus maximus]|uniref:Uncharacterized protein n=1 Tax=Scophthalmus maximus TaxID=52904 RepID=A0A6A4TL31_SCOMX|nr:hypothetical protein F2P81_004079 [Scophthalmus maximus]